MPTRLPRQRNTGPRSPGSGDPEARFSDCRPPAGYASLDVISDARGSSRSDVTVTVSRVGPNQVEVSSDYARIPTVRITLTRAMEAILADGTDHVFLIQRDADPDQLSLTIDDASLSVRRQRE